MSVVGVHGITNYRSGRIAADLNVVWGGYESGRRWTG